MKNKYFAIFGGGGIRGISYCGAYKALVENNIELCGYAGSSIGAVFACLLSIGYTYQEIYEISVNTGFDLFIDINMNFKKEVAFSKGKIFYDWIKEKIEKKFYGEKYKKGENKEVTFFDIKSDLIIYSTNLTDLTLKEFSKHLTPNFEVAKAVRASVSMPGLFSPLELDNKLIVDGDLIKSMPLWRVSNHIKNLEGRILEFRLEDNRGEKEVNSSIDYLNRVYNAISGFASDYIIDLYGQKDKFDYIKINTDDISVVDFLISKEKKQELFEIGYCTTNDYFKNHFPKKKKILKEKYSKLFNLITNFQKEFLHFNIINSYLKLCEIFMFLCEENKYLDTNIYDNILNFKNKYLKNYKKINIFGFKSSLVSNKEILEKDLLEIIKSIGAKVDEFKI